MFNHLHGGSDRYRVLHAFWLKGGGGGGHFEVKEGHLDFLQIT